MIRLLIVAMMSLISFLITAQNKQTQTLSGTITAIDVTMPVKVIIDATKNSDQIEIITDEKIDKDIVTIKQVGNKLVINMKNLKGISKRVSSISKAEVRISQKGIVNYNVSTAGKVEVNGRVSGDVVKINLDSAANLMANFSANTVIVSIDSASKYIGSISAKNVKCSIDSAAKATVDGDVESLTVNVDSAGVFDGKKLKAKHVKVEVDSMGKAEVFPTESLNAYADSMGRVIYHNTPKELKKYTDSMGSIKAE